MNVKLNGEVTELAEEASVADAVAVTGAGEAARGIAVAVGGEVVPRAEWAERMLGEGDEVEVVNAVQGG